MWIRKTGGALVRFALAATVALPLLAACGEEDVAQDGQRPSAPSSPDPTAGDTAGARGPATAEPTGTDPQRTGELDTDPSQGAPAR